MGPYATPPMATPPARLCSPDWVPSGWCLRSCYSPPTAAKVAGSNVRSKIASGSEHEHEAAGKFAHPHPAAVVLKSEVRPRHRVLPEIRPDSPDRRELHFNSGAVIDSEFGDAAAIDGGSRGIEACELHTTAR